MPQLTQPTPGEINYAIGLLKAQRNNEAIDFLSRLHRRHSLSVPVIQLLSNVPTSYPGNNILTEDLGEIFGVDNCKCKRAGKYFKVYGRIPSAELRGCSNADL